MSQIVQEHLRKYPGARPSTLIILQRKAEVTAQLQAEIKAEKRRKRLSFWRGFSDAFFPWIGPAVVAGIAIGVTVRFWGG